MEVHSHTHTARKKWTHYLWEFLMLFLAVFCGFLAENLREHRVEQQREKKYIRSMIADLKSDTTTFSQVVRVHQRNCDSLDTLITLLTAKERAKWARRIYMLARFTPLDDPFLSCQDKTFEQMKNSGSLRLIHNSDVLDQVSGYYQWLKFIEKGPTAMQYQNRRDYMLALDEVFNAAAFQELMRNYGEGQPDAPAEHFLFLTSDPVSINKVCNRFHFMYSTNKVVRQWAIRYINRAAALLERLKKEYHLE